MFNRNLNTLLQWYSFLLETKPVQSLKRPHNDSRTTSTAITLLSLLMTSKKSIKQSQKNLMEQIKDSKIWRDQKIRTRISDRKIKHGQDLRFCLIHGHGRQGSGHARPKAPYIFENFLTFPSSLSFKRFSNSCGCSYTKFMILDVKSHFTCGEPNLH